MRHLRFEDADDMIAHLHMLDVATMTAHVITNDGRMLTLTQSQETTIEAEVIDVQGEVNE